MKKLLLVLPFLFALGLQAQPGGGGMLPNTANRVLTGNGVPSGSTCNNAASVGKVYLRKNAAAANASFYTCDNTASMTYAWELSSGGGGGAGTVTVVGAGSLTSTAFTTGGGSQALQTPCATCTLDVSGNGALLSLTLGLGGSVAGYDAYGQGTATTAPTSSVGFQGPVSVTTKFMMTLPGAPISGFVYNTGTSDPSTLSFLSPTFAAQTDGSTVTWAIGNAVLANGTLTFTTHGGSRTLNITGALNGGSYVLWLKQDGTGGEGLTLGSGCTWKVSGSGVGAITPSVGANAIDVLAFTYDGTNCYANFAKSFT